MGASLLALAKSIYYIQCDHLSGITLSLIDRWWSGLGETYTEKPWTTGMS